MSEAADRGDPVPPPCTLVIFGAGGDLTKRLLMPSIYNLRVVGLLPDGFRVIGIDRVEGNDESYRTQLTESMRGFVSEHPVGGTPQGLDEAEWGWVRDRLHYMTGDFLNPETYRRLAERIEGNAVFYLAVSARFFGPAVDQLADAGLTREAEGAYRRVVVEKPFGSDLASARALDKRILDRLSESQIYRMDHFLGKETVQNILALRFSNGIFEPLWRRDHIDHVQITAAETVGVEARGTFYEATGGLRDMVPNHMFQLLAMVAMEPPNSFDADVVRGEKAKLIQAIKPFTPASVLRDVVRGQYAEGEIKGQAVPGYRQEPNVAADSVTETYVAMRLEIDNWRWAGVPFYIRTGKRMPVRRTEISVHFKQAPHTLFRDTPVEQLTTNILVLHVQPDEGITFHFSAKQPGPAVILAGVGMDFRYSDYFHTGPSTGYETLLYDVMIGDATLFQRADNVETGWAAVQPLIDVFGTGGMPPLPYAAGTSGPKAADQLLERDGRKWLKLT